MFNKDILDEIEKKCENLPDGPWKSEPNRILFKRHGFQCLIQRHPIFGFFCGYVGVPKGHPWFGKHYRDVDVKVHGGLTYSKECEGPICHPSDDGDEKLFWLGFDCGHAYDLAPCMIGKVPELIIEGSKYRDLEYVEKECRSLAKQAAAAAR